MGDTSGDRSRAEEIAGFVERRNTAEGRFGVRLVETDFENARLVMEMPFGDLVHPDTGTPCLGLLTILVDGAGGSANYVHFRGERWSVTSELSLDLASEAATLLHPGSTGMVRCDARTVHADDSSVIALCQLSIGDTQVGVGTVRSFGIPAGDGRPSRGLLAEDGPHELFEMLALSPSSAEVGVGVYALSAGSDFTLHNAMGLMHGGAVTAALDVVATAALSRHGHGVPMSTGSMRVNFLRPMIIGPDARYEGEVLRAGRSTALTDARAINADGKVATIARATSYALPGR